MKRGTFPRRSLTALPVDHGKVAIIRWPRELLLSLTQTLEFHGKLTFTDLIVRERLQNGSTGIDHRVYATTVPLGAMQAQTAGRPK